MKRITIKQCLLACFVLPMILAGCNDADYQVIDNAIYLNEASENGSAKVTVDPENVTTTTLTVRVGQPVTENVTAVLTVDPSILKEYNEANETSYEVLPEQYFTYDKEIKIAAGDVSAIPSEFRVNLIQTKTENCMLFRYLSQKFRDRCLQSGFRRTLSFCWISR